MIKLGKFITNKLWLKLISLVVAVLLWFIVVNVTDPITDRKFDATLNIRGISTLAQNNYVLLNASELSQIKVELRIQGSTSNLQLLKNSSNINAYVNLNPIDYSRTLEFGENLPIRVQYEFPNASNYSVLNVTPQEVYIVLDKKVEKDVKLTVNKIGGDMEGYVSLTPICEPETIRISGPKSTIDTVSLVGVDVDTSGATEAISAIQQVKVTDSEGEDITSKITLAESEVHVTIPIQKYARIPISNPTLTGAPAYGYSITAIDIEPKYVEVVGSEEDIQNLKSLTLPIIEATNAWKQTQQIPFDLRSLLMPTNLDIKNGTPKELTVTITIEQEIIKTLRIPISEIEVRGATNQASFPNPYIDITVRGVEEWLEGLNGYLLNSFVDISTLTPGEHNVAVNLELPEGISFVGQPPAIKVIIASEDSEIN